jgi:4-amino-4-deoxy-L-arabinose transferase-like glycosyltransferase
VKKITFIIIVLLAVVLRFYKLGEVPISLDWDEVSLGYNAYTLLLTGNDEFGNSWPLSIRSFNDYKPPAYTYLDIIPTAIFGLNEFGTRFPAAFFGVLAVVGVFFLTREFFKDTKSSKYIAHVAMLIFAISPWHLQFSRAAFEGGIAVFFVVWGMFFLLRYLSLNKTYYLYLACVFLAGSFYAYHAARLIVPLLVVGVVLRYRKELLLRWKSVLGPALLGVVLLFPVMIVLFSGSASERFSSVSIFDSETVLLRPLEYEREDKATDSWESWMHNRRVEYAKEFVNGYLNHYNVANMFLKGDVVERHHAPDMGLFYLIELPLICVGIYSLIRSKFKYKFVFFYWALIAPLPAAISTGTPHAIRSILFLPIPQIAVAFGVVKLWSMRELLTNEFNGAFRNISRAALVILFCINFGYYLNQYYVHMDVEYALNWQYGYKELIVELEKIEDNYDKIVITTAYDQPYIYFLYYKKYDPRVWVNNGEFNKGFDKYEFRKVEWLKDRHLTKVLLVGDKLEVMEGEPTLKKVIRVPEGKTGKDDIFRIIPSDKQPI